MPFFCVRFTQPIAAEFQLILAEAGCGVPIAPAQGNTTQNLGYPSFHYLHALAQIRLMT
jgi:hypothetical protein